MGAADMLEWLRTAGMLVEVDGDKLRITPAGELDDTRRALIRKHKAEMVALLTADEHSVDLGAALSAAINRACDTRGDDPENRAALLSECAELRSEQQAELLAHFVVVAARCGAAREHSGHTNP